MADLSTDDLVARLRARTALHRDHAVDLASARLMEEAAEALVLLTAAANFWHGFAHHSAGERVLLTDAAGAMSAGIVVPEKLLRDAHDAMRACGWHRTPPGAEDETGETVWEVHAVEETVGRLLDPRETGDGTR